MSSADRDLRNRVQVRSRCSGEEISSVKQKYEFEYQSRYGLDQWFQYLALAATDFIGFDTANLWKDSSML